MLRFIFSVIGGLFSLVTLGLIAVALSIGAVFYIYGRDLPSHESLAQYQPPTISRIYSGEGRMLDEFAKERRLFTPAEEIPGLVKHAFISAEDKNFYTHQGYDTRGIASAALDAARGDGLRGASTITQQVVKNFLLSADRRIERKIKEIILATRLEGTLDKEDILELYLNEIFLGQNSFGVTAAAQTYFNKTLGELAPHEAAMLAAMPKAPSNYHPVRNKTRVKNRRNFVLKEMYENGYIAQEVYLSEREEPLRSVQNGDFEPFKNSLPPRDYFTDEIRRQLSKDFGEEEFFTGGMTVRATIEPEMQELAAASLQTQLEGYDRAQGDWRGTGERIPAEALENEADWRAALADVSVSRDIDLDGHWYPAVVLAVEEQRLRIGIEDVEETEAEPFTVPRKDIAWLKQDPLATASRVAVDSKTDAAFLHCEVQ